MERVLGPRLVTRKQVLALIKAHGGPQGTTKASEARLLRTASKANPRRATELVDAILTALGEQAVTVPDTAAAEIVPPKLATTSATVLDQRAEIAAQVEQVLEAHSLAKVVTSMPGVVVRTAARILLDVGDTGTFRTAGHLAAYARQARRRCDVLHAMLRTGTHFQPPAAESVPAV